MATAAETEKINVKQTKEYTDFMERAFETKVRNFKQHFPEAWAKLEKMEKEGKAIIKPAAKKAAAKSKK